ncbi:tetratricopeptide repeat protein [Phormidium sp. LEGE 05292]|uniref:tetratricopeptide repeat protein n=1 Tax=[Phormidium] sp. LEGE 05292 TaxID=767427 RepID=UPI0018818951|nr:tetratricopeptide repeat protein [Phormidium sp. LEGE 05292]MBE9226218.1 tetratricopeptide repeat protein [Phormidium sp. LEGE 05292]
MNSPTAENFCNTGNQLKTEKRFDEAIASYQKALQLQPDYAEVHYQLAEIYFVQRKLRDAIAFCNKAIQLQPDFAPNHKILGNILQTQGNLEAALNAYVKALELNPEFAEAYINQGSILSKLGRNEEAIVSLEKAIAINPNIGAAYWNLANVYLQLDNLEKVVECRKQAFSLEPKLVNAETLNDLGTAIGKLGDFEEAINYYHKAIELQPNYHLAHLNLGVALRRISKLDAAKEELQIAIKLKPDDPEAYNNLGSVLVDQNQIDAGIFNYEKALKLKPDSAEYHFNLGTALGQKDKFTESIKELQKAVELQPDLGKAYSNIGAIVYRKTRKDGEISGELFNLAINSLLKALEIDSDLELAHLYLAQLITSPVRASDFGALRQASAIYLERSTEKNHLIAVSTFIGTHVKSALTQLAKEKFLEIEPEIYNRLEKMNNIELSILYSNVLFNLHYLRDDLAANTQLYQAVGKKYAEQIIAAKQITISQPEKKQLPTTNLKIGVMSSHFARHSVGWCSADIITELGKLTPNLYLYFMGDRQPDDRTKIFESAAAKFYRPKAKENGEFDINQIVQDIAQDELDILIELDSSTIPSQVEVIYHQPASVCLSWLGFEAPFTKENNYFLCDWNTHPEGREKYNREQLVRMPDSFVAVGGFKSTPIDTKAVRKSQRIAEDQIIYLCVAPGYKLNPEQIQAQVKILKEVPDSILMYKGHTGDLKVIESAYKTECQAQGVGFQRIKIMSRSASEEEHRQVYQVADIMLDSYPYNGGTHNLEALWFNLPVVTKSGETYLSRMGYSFLKTLSLNECITNSWDEYIEKGIKLGKDQGFRQSIKEKLLQSKQPETLSPLWNPQKFAQDMYKVFEQLLAEKLGNK